VEPSRGYVRPVQSLYLPEPSKSNVPGGRAQGPGPRVRHKLHALKGGQAPGESDISAVARCQAGVRPALPVQRGD